MDRMVTRDIAKSLQIYRSSNGDRWLLIRDRASGTAYVRHEANPASGGQVTDIEIEAFLSQGHRGPEHQALLALIGT